MHSSLGRYWLVVDAAVHPGRVVVAADGRGDRVPHGAGDVGVPERLIRGTVAAGGGPSGGVVGDNPPDAGRVRHSERRWLDGGDTAADAGRHHLVTAATGAAVPGCY